MSITATTLAAAVAATDTSVLLASGTGVSNPVFTTGSGYTFLKIDDELMFVSGNAGTNPNVVRGQAGTVQTAHESSAPVLIGGPSDFANFIPVQKVDSPSLPYNFSPIGAPLTGATIAPLYGYIHHFTGSTALVTITVPSGLVSGGAVTLVMDGSGSGLTWTAAGNIAVAGTATTAASAVTFFYDPASAKWIPSRLA